jgi:RNA polymerase sigma factor (sigma-70 family)
MTLDPRETPPLLDVAHVYREHAPGLRRFALYLSGSAAGADDLVSEAFVRLWTTRERIVVSTLRAYLFAIVRNLFLQGRRNEWRRAPLREDCADYQPGPEDLLSDRSELRIVLAAVGRLPEIDRAAVLMRAAGGLSYEDIAVTLGLSTAAAKVKVHRARLKLAEARVGAVGTGRAEERKP